jgi:hypothetical protein
MAGERLWYRETSDDSLVKAQALAAAGALSAVTESPLWNPRGLFRGIARGAQKAVRWRLPCPTDQTTGPPVTDEQLADICGPS